MGEAKWVQCWGCECDVPLTDHGTHREPTNLPGTVYEYPCTNPRRIMALRQFPEVRHG